MLRVLCYSKNMKKYVIKIDRTDKKSILQYCRENGIDLCPAPCGGKGTCGKCKVHITKPYDKVVLACQTMAEKDMEISAVEAQNDNMVVLAGDNVGNSAESYDEANSVGNSAEFYDEANSVGNSAEFYDETDNERKAGILMEDMEQKDKALDGVLAACDIGTTTIVCNLMDPVSGKILAARAGANPQRSFGADVVSRIEAVQADPINLKTMNREIINLISGWISEMLLQINSKKVKLLTVAANTTMCHLFAGISPEKIGKAPFMPDELFGKEYKGAGIGILNCEKVYIIPAVSGYVGGDITAGMAECIDADEMTLYLDIGTNGEMALGRGGKYLCAATAAGPAFEGAQIEMGMPGQKGAIDKVWLEGRKICYSVIGNVRPLGICGSGIIDAIAVFLDTGIIDENGTIKDMADIPLWYRPYVEVFDDEDDDEDIYPAETAEKVVHISPEVILNQDDIRKIQLAKSAIAAGIDVLIKEYGITYKEIDRVCLAGGFGNYLDQKSAARIGLIPEKLLKKTVSVGNAAQKGAIATAYIYEDHDSKTETKILNKDIINKTNAIISTMAYIELSTYPGFDEMYVSHINFTCP